MSERRPFDSNSKVNRQLTKQMVANWDRLPRASSAGRERGKFVALPDGASQSGPGPNVGNSPSIFQDLDPPSPLPEVAYPVGRITIYCTADTYDLDLLRRHLGERGNSTFLEEEYADVVHQEFKFGEETYGHGFYFDYGCLAFWGLSQSQEQEALRTTVRVCAVDPLPADKVEIDEFQFTYSMGVKPHIENDTITMSWHLVDSVLAKLSISYALTQSTKLSVFEERASELVAATKYLPSRLATTGEVHMSSGDIAKLIGRVFILKCAVNLVLSVLDTPDFIWNAPDTMEAMYKRVCEYVELETRVEVLNERFQVLQEILNMLRSHENKYHTTRLELIVIWLLVIEVIIALSQCAGFIFTGHA